VVDASDLVPGQYLPGHYEATAVKIDRNVRSGRRAEVVLEDDAGGRVLFADFVGAETGVDWKQGARYRIMECAVQNNSRGQEATLAPGKQTEIVERTAVGQETTLLVLGDTHAGRICHPKDKSIEIDTIGAFERAAEIAISSGVDAVVHAGDVFHDTDGPEHLMEVDNRALTPLAEHGIPFYYVTGNHGHEAREWLLSQEHLEQQKQLTAGGVSLNDTVRLCGVDHPDSGGRTLSEYRFPRRPSEPFSMLVIHRTIKQLPPNDAGDDLNDIQGPATGFDLVVAGHNHDATETLWCGREVFYTGAAAPMSKNSDPTDGVAWLVTTDGTSVQWDPVRLTDNTD